MTWADGTIQAHSADLSRAGLFIETTNRIAVGTAVLVEFKVSGTSRGDQNQGKGSTTHRYPVTVECEVSRIVTLEEATAQGSLPGIGIEFVKMIAGEVAIENFIAARLSAIRPERPSSGAVGQHSRAVVALPVFWGTDPSLGREGHLRSLGPSGGFLETTEPAPAGTRIHLKFELPRADSSHQLVSTTAVVAEMHPPEGRHAWGLEIAFEPEFLRRNQA